LNDVEAKIDEQPGQDEARDERPHH
jgi:hypothetical protein